MVSESDFVAEPWRLPSWRKPIQGAAFPKPQPVPLPPAVTTLEQQIVTEPVVLNAMADSIAASSGLKAIARDIREGKLSQPKNPKMRGLIDSMSKFNHQVDCDIDDASKLIATAHARRTEVFGKVRDHVAASVVDLNDMLQNFDDLESAIGDNGAPSSVGDSQGSPATSANSTDGKAV